MMDRPAEVRPVLAGDVSQVAQFLHEHMNGRPGVDAWQRLMEPPWPTEQPNRGFQLVAESRIVGAYVGVYSTRIVDGVERRLCNLAAFCVLPDYRGHGLRLYRAIVGQRGYEFTDLSPSGNVIRLNERMGFRRLDNATTLVPNYPWRAGRSVQVAEDPELIRACLAEPDLSIFLDHRRAPAARHLVVRSQDSYAYLMYRRDRRKRLPIFASPLYVGGDRRLLSAAWPAVATRLLGRGMLVTLAERRVLGFVPPGGRLMANQRPKMFRSKVLSEREIDYLYSELALLEW